MIRIAIVEDDDIYKEQLIEFLNRFKHDTGESIEVTTYSDGDEIVQNYTSSFDIILMDIQMNFMDGMSAAEEIRKMDSKVVIIFITSTAQYAIKGYEVDALDYILKPISYFAFSQRLKRAIDRMKKREDQYITINVKGGLQRIKVRDIYYIESQGHNLIFYTKWGELISTGTMKEIDELLSKLYFFRGNRGYLINLEHVDGMKDGCAMVRGEMLLISRSRKNAFMEALTSYWGEMVK